MKRLKFLFLFIAGVYIFSCGEDDLDPITYPSLYHKSGTEVVGSLRLFSSQGEIKNQLITSTYMQRDTPSFNNFIRFVRSYEGIMDSVQVFDPQHARLNHEWKQTDCSLSTEGDLLVLTKREVSPECCFPDDTYTKSLPYYLSRVKPEVHSEFIDSSTGGNYYFGYRGKKKFVLKRVPGGKLVAPVMWYTRHSTNTYYYSGNLNNILQNDFYRNLATGDTVTLMEFNILLEK
jgi:hypothetical protein